MENPNFTTHYPEIKIIGIYVEETKKVGIIYHTVEVKINEDDYDYSVTDSFMDLARIGNVEAEGNEVLPFKVSSENRSFPQLILTYVLAKSNIGRIDPEKVRLVNIEYTMKKRGEKNG